MVQSFWLDGGLLVLPWYVGVGVLDQVWLIPHVKWYDHDEESDGTDGGTDNNMDNVYNY